MRENEISRFQSILESVLNKRTVEFALPEDQKIKSLLDKHPIHILVDSQLSQYTYILSQSIKERIQNIAIFNIANDDISHEDRFNARKQTNDGNWFSTGIFLDLRKQLYLESKLIDESRTVLSQIVDLLWAYTGNGLYYKFNEVIISTIFDYAIDLFLINGNEFNLKNFMLECDIIIAAINHFGLKYDSDYILKDGQFLITECASKRIHGIIENIIKRVGGKRTLEILFATFLTPKYDSQIDRYLIHRNKQTYAIKKTSTPIPFKYLIQLASKHLIVMKPSFLMPLSDNDVELLFGEMIKNCQAYVDLLEIYNPSSMSDAMIDFETLPEYLSKNILLETLCFPEQYSPKFVDLVVKEIYLPQLIESSGYPDFYKSKHMPSLIQAILESVPCSVITAEFLHKKTNVRKSMITDFLAHFSQGADEVNGEFNGIMEKTNTQEYPLIRLNDNDYFLVSAHFCGYSFCEKIYKTIKAGFVSGFDNKLGVIVEKLTRKLLDKKDYSYKCGKYAEGNDTEQTDCDVILETDKKIFFIEVKKRPLPEVFDVGDDVEVLRCLGEGMLTAQKQAFKHRLYLKNHGRIDLGTYIVEYGDKSIHAISICLPEYKIFTTKTFAQRLTESLLFVSYGAYDKTKKHRLNKLNALAEEFRFLVNSYADGVKVESNQLFFDISFRSLQQFWVALNHSVNIEDFIENITCDNHVIFGSLDYYSHLKWQLSQEK